ncbi:MAG TPA: CGNR zinc finger domain-containing protein [Vicinamibacteria bacterium]|nr:CGNR zinc finger domain-containing protein [Vicinamibacteria bacterium]
MRFDSYADAGVLTAVKLVNAPGSAAASSSEEPGGTLPSLAKILALDPPSVARLRKGDEAGFVTLARALGRVFEDLRRGDVDRAASRLNDLLARYPAHPHLAKQQGRWRLHHHPADAALVAMWTAICAEGMARVLGSGQGRRLGTCGREGCGRVFFDASRNGSRRFCSTRCQNRVKAAAFRSRIARKK